MTKSSIRRSYSSPRRDAKASQTRQRILAAARALFVRDGFTATSMAAIGRKAKVATPTLYAVFGSKRGILMALAELISEEARQIAQIKDVSPLGEPRAQLRVLARFQRVHGEIGGDVLHMVQSAAAIDREAAAVVREREHGRRVRIARLVEAWKQRGLLRAGLDTEIAVDVLWALSDPSLYRLFVGGAGWSAERFERWLQDTWEAQVLE